MYSRIIQDAGDKLNNLISAQIKNKKIIPAFVCASVIGMTLFAPEIFALSNEDQVAELVPLTAEVSKLSKNACYIIGSASAAIGTLWSVAAQNLKIFAASAAITILAFKAPSFFSIAMWV